MPEDLTRELEAAVAAARKAADLIRSERGSVDAGSVREKGRHDLVTKVDLMSQDLIIGLLSTEFPEYAVLAEEEGSSAASSQADASQQSSPSSQSHGSTRSASWARSGSSSQSDASPQPGTASHSGRRWVIDPIDGTTNFTHGVPPYSVSIALLDDDTPIVGVILEVVSGETFTAVRGEGSYVDGRRMHVSKAATLDEALISTGFPYRSVTHIDEYLSVLREFLVRSRGVRRHGSAAIDLAYLAAGRFDGFFETGLMPWDVRAGILLITEAGGRISTFDGTGDAIYEEQILASNGRIHEEMKSVVGALARVFEQGC